MSRIIVIPADAREPLREVSDASISNLADHFGHERLIERVSSGPLRELATIENVPVLVVDEEGRLDHQPYNERASVLYVPAAARLHHFIAGDALVVGEGITDEGPDFIGLSEHIGVADIEALIERYERI